MDYKKIYYNIIENRKKNPISKSEYGERHHIIPKSLNGSDDISNIVKLTAREHFICHALLAEMYEENTMEWYKMNHAFMMMKSESHNQSRYFNSKLYESKRNDFSKIMSFSQFGDKNSQYGKQKSKNHIKKIKNTFRKKYGGILPSECKNIEKKKQVSKFTVNGKFINNYRVKKIKEIFGMDLYENPKLELDKLKNILYDLYRVQKKSTNEIAKLFKTNNETIRNYLIYLEIDRRNLSESVKNYKKNQCISNG
jgi:hypothetical protein